MNTGETSLEDGTIVVLNHAQGISEISGGSSFETTSEVHSQSFSHGTSKSNASSLAKQESHGISRSSQTSKTHTIGASQSLEPIIKVFPTTPYSLQEQEHRAAWMIKKLPPGEAILEPPLGKSIRIIAPLIRPGYAKDKQVDELTEAIFETQPSAQPAELAEAEILRRQQLLLSPHEEPVEREQHLGW